LLNKKTDFSLIHEQQISCIKSKSEGGEAYMKDLPNAEIHRLATEHFAVEDCLGEIAAGIHRFYPEKVKKITSNTQFLMP
jgi:hypothetical protein